MVWASETNWLIIEPKWMWAFQWYRNETCWKDLSSIEMNPNLKFGISTRITAFRHQKSAPNFWSEWAVCSKFKTTIHFRMVSEVSHEVDFPTAPISILRLHLACKTPGRLLTLNYFYKLRSNGWILRVSSVKLNGSLMGLLIVCSSILSFNSFPEK